MLDRDSKKRDDSCVSCGGTELRLVAGRVGKLKESGHANLFQCVGCGHLDWRDIPHQPPGRRT